MNPDPRPAPDRPRPAAFVLAGPTASGKTGLAHGLALRLGARILSADSMHVYRHLNIGTAKPSRDELAAFRYAGVDLVDPDSACSAGDYLRSAGDAVRDDPAATWLVVGGTGLYIKCLTQGLDPAPGADAGARAEADAVFAEGGLPALQALARKLAPEAAGTMRDPENPRRLIRLIERARQGGIEESRAWNGAPPRIVALSVGRDELGRRIETRIRGMIDAGLLEEARALREHWPRLSPPAAQAIGYREAWDVLDGACSAPDAAGRIAARTRQLAKRQMTWFRHQASVDWVDAGGDRHPDAVCDEILRYWETHGPAPLEC